MLKNTFVWRESPSKVRDKPAHTCRQPLPLVQWCQIHRRRRRKKNTAKAKDWWVKSKSRIAGTNEACGIKGQKEKEEWSKKTGEGKMVRKVGEGAVAKAATEGVSIAKRQLDRCSWFDPPFSILMSEAVLYCALRTRPGLCAGQNQLWAAWCGPACCAGTRSAVSLCGSWGCAIFFFFKRGEKKKMSVQLHLVWFFKVQNKLHILFILKIKEVNLLMLCYFLTNRGMHSSLQSTSDYETFRASFKKH